MILLVTTCDRGEECATALQKATSEQVHVIKSTRPLSQSGSSIGFLFVSTGAADIDGSSTALPSSGPVVESNGLRERIACALVA